MVADEELCFASHGVDMTDTQTATIAAGLQEISNQVVILQVGIAFLIIAAFASMIYAWRS